MKQENKIKKKKKKKRAERASARAYGLHNFNITDHIECCTPDFTAGKPYLE